MRSKYSLFLLSLLIIGTLTKQSIAGLNDGLVAFYPFNGNANDESESGNNGTVYGATLTIDGFGNVNSAYHFDGINDYISVQDNDSLDLSNIRTIGAWYRMLPKTGDENNTILGKYRSDTINEDGYIIIDNQLPDNNKLRLWAKDGLGGGSVPPEIIGYNFGTWRHVILVIENNQVKSYIDGKYNGTGYPMNNSLGNSNPLLIGAGLNHLSQVYNYFYGDIDNIRIYNRVLSESEIQQLYDIESPLKKFPDDTMAPTGAVHAYGDIIWPPNNKMSSVLIDGYVVDELSINRDKGGIGISSAYLMVNGNKFVLKGETINLLNEKGNFSVTTEVEARKGETYRVELYATDTEPKENSGPNSGFVDSTYIRVRHDVSNK